MRLQSRPQIRKKRRRDGRNGKKRKGVCVRPKPTSERTPAVAVNGERIRELTQWGWGVGGASNDDEV